MSEKPVAVEPEKDNKQETAPTKKPKSTIVKDAISKGRTITGAKPDEIKINPVLEAAEKTAVMAYGRFNPPTTGHEKLIHKVEGEAKKVGGTAHIIASHSEGNTKNPLPKEKKAEYIKAVAQPGTHVSHSTSEAPSLLHQAARLHNHAHHLVMVAGSDRVKEYETLLNKYNGQHGPHGHYNFKSIKVVSAGARDPDAEGTTGMSGTKMREHANAGNVGAFKKGLPKALHDHAEEMMRTIQKVKDVEPIKKVKDAAKKKVKEDVDAAFEEMLDEGLNAAQRTRKGINLRRIEYKLQMSKKRSLSKHATVGVIMKRARKMAIDRLKKRFSGGQDVSTLNAMEKSRIEDIVKKKKGAIKRLAQRLAVQVRKNEQKRFAPKKEDFEIIGDIYDQLTEAKKKLDLKDTHKREEGTDSLRDIYSRMTPGQTRTESVDEVFSEMFGKEREVASRHGQDRKKMSLVPRDGEDRKTDDRFYRQQSIQKKIIEQEIFDETIEEGMDFHAALNKTMQALGVAKKHISRGSTSTPAQKARATIQHAFLKRQSAYLRQRIHQNAGKRQNQPGVYKRTMREELEQFDVDLAFEVMLENNNENI